MRDLLAAIAEDHNGDHVYNNVRATIGYVTEAEKLRVIAGMNFDEPPNLDLVQLGSQTAFTANLGQAGDAWRTNNPVVGPLGTNLTALNKLKLVLLNAQPLVNVNTGIDNKRACFIALLRVRWLTTGCLFATRAARAVTHDEVVVVPVTHPVVMAADYDDLRALPDYADLMTYLGSTNGLNVATFVVSNAEIIWNTAEHMVRVRGHHYRPEYEKIIQTTYKSASAGNVEWPDEFYLVDALRTAIHPFGLKALVCIAYKNIWHGLVGNGLIKRITGASNGYACATTAYAGFAMISSEPWYAVWSAAYTQQIDLVTKFSVAMLNDRYSYHESAALYGIEPKRSITVGTVQYSMNDVENAVNAVAPVLQGFIQWSREAAQRANDATYAFANAKVLEKRAAMNPVMVLKMTALLEATVRHVTDATTTKDSIKEAFPELD